MPISSNFVIIGQDKDAFLGDGSLRWTDTFDVQGLYNDERGAILMLMVKGLTHAKDPVTVVINGQGVGEINPYRWPTEANRVATMPHWYTQIIRIPSGVLRNGTNELTLRAIGYPNSTPSNVYDDFLVRNIVCFYHHQ